MATNPYVNKVQLADGTSLIDISDTTATADKIMQGYTAYGADGQKLTGTATGGGGSGVVWQDADGYVHLSDEGDIPLQTKTVTPSETAQTVTPDSGYYALQQVNVGAISSTYVGSGVTRRSSSDLTASGATVTVPSGYYSAQASKAVTSGTVTAPNSISGTSAAVSTGTNTLTLSKTVSVTPNVTAAGYISSGTAGNSSVSLTASISTRSSSDLTVSGATVSVPSGYYSANASKAVATGTAGTPTATKGTVSNHAVSVTPSVTNTTGYITGGTKTGTAVSVSASELVSGTYSVTGSGTKDVTNYASVSVPSGTEGTPTATKGTVSNHSITVTPSVTNTTGYITGGTKTGTAVTVSASELVSGSETKTANGTYDVTNLASLVVNVSGGGGGATNIVQGTFTAGTAGTVQTINVPYTGDGYPIELNISVQGGTYVNNSGDTNAQTWYDTIHQYAVGKYSMTKCGATNAPVFSGSNVFIDGGTVTSVYKSSSSNNTSYSSVYSLNYRLYKSGDPTADSTALVTIPSTTSFKVFVSGATSGYGFLSGLVYSYCVVYSS